MSKYRKEYRIQDTEIQERIQSEFLWLRFNDAGVGQRQKPSWLFKQVSFFAAVWLRCCDAASLGFSPRSFETGLWSNFKADEVHKGLFFSDLMTMEDDTTMRSRNSENYFASEPVSDPERTDTWFSHLYRVPGWRICGPVPPPPQGLLAWYLCVVMDDFCEICGFHSNFAEDLKVLECEAVSFG